MVRAAQYPHHALLKNCRPIGIISGTVAAVAQRSQAQVAFGRTVRSVRVERGLSQERLADLCGLHRTYVGGVERGERNVTLATTTQFASGLELTWSELMARVGAELEPK
jgi:DNA-binding XRE family transcriptional regulator